MSSENNRDNIPSLNCDHRFILNIVKAPKTIKLYHTSLSNLCHSKAETTLLRSTQGKNRFCIFSFKDLQVGEEGAQKKHVVLDTVFSTGLREKDFFQSFFQGSLCLTDKFLNLILHLILHHGNHCHHFIYFLQ